MGISFHNKTSRFNFFFIFSIAFSVLSFHFESFLELSWPCYKLNQNFLVPNDFRDACLGIRSYSLSYFSAMLNGGVFKLSAHACRRVFEELDERKRKKKVSSSLGPVQDETFTGGSSSFDSDKEARNEIYSFKHDILLRYDAMW